MHISEEHWCFQSNKHFVNDIVIFIASTQKFEPLPATQDKINGISTSWGELVRHDTLEAMKEECVPGEDDEDDTDDNDDDDDEDDDDERIWPGKNSTVLRLTDSKRNGRNVRLLRSDERVGGTGWAEELMRLTSVK
jgi:hypothetical protein